MTRTSNHNSNMISNCGCCNGKGYTFENNIIKICKCQQVSIIQNKLKMLGIPEEFNSLSVNSFDTSIYKSEENIKQATIIKHQASNYIIKFDELKQIGKGLYFYSRAKGSGKTRLALSMANALINRLQLKCLFYSVIEIIEAIKSTFGTEKSYHPLIIELCSADVLILDDFGVERPTAFVEEQLYFILNHRMVHKKITFFTSNCMIEELKFGERIKSRIDKMTLPIMFPEFDVRKVFSKKENDALLKILSK